MTVLAPSPPITGTTLVAGVAGSPVSHSLSPTLHNAWISESRLDAVYVAFHLGADSFTRFAEGLRGGAIRGLNVTAPFKHTALTLADAVSDRASRAGSANLLLFQADGTIRADNTDGLGLLYAFRSQAPAYDPSSAPVIILGAGGAARGAVAAFLGAGVREIWVVNRDPVRAAALVDRFGPAVKILPAGALAAALGEAGALVNATPQGLGDTPPPQAPFGAANPRCVVMDMIYKPIRTAFLIAASDAGLRTVDGLAMLIGQAIPSFEAFFNCAPPEIDIRSLALEQIGRFP
jgi:shikimate dehydrogenase